MNALADEIRGRAHVDHLGRAGIADGARAAHEQNGVLIDRERRIVDVGVIFLGPVEHDRATFEGIRIGRIGQIARAELRGSRWSS